ncbi:MAG: quinone-interacting membrane-bound oxidoreductase complex subunit QmoC [Deltaproteobacteria bacterium]|nr:quinone-interacting membrane-bound oxidoreductase complex subunit QmoC [Deltaproteobacteria bacterium]
MGSQNTIISSEEFRKELIQRGVGSVARCYQCATCSSVCELAPDKEPFPRRQMLWAQWGLADMMIADPGVWLCHQCNDCNLHCPRDAKPGDVMQVVRSLAVEKLAVPGFVGRLVGKAGLTWPLLLGLPLLFWVAVLYLLNGLSIPESPLIFHDFVPHWLIYLVYIPLTGGVGLMMLLSGWKFWKMLSGSQNRSGSFIGSTIKVMFDIGTHKRFGKCQAAGSRRWGHFSLMWGFVGAVIATTLAIVALYILKEYPLPLTHPFKIVGNVAAVFLVVGCILLLGNRLQENSNAGISTAYDNFFLAMILLVTFTGVFTEIGRFALEPSLACSIYIVHLASVMSLFATFPYSKFAHFVYRTLAMIHERMVESK